MARRQQYRRWHKGAIDVASPRVPTSENSWWYKRTTLQPSRAPLCHRRSWSLVFAHICLEGECLWHISDWTRCGLAPRPAGPPAGPARGFKCRCQILTLPNDFEQNKHLARKRGSPICLARCLRYVLKELVSNLHEEHLIVLSGPRKKQWLQKQETEWFRKPRKRSWKGEPIHSS